MTDLLCNWSASPDIADVVKKACHCAVPVADHAALLNSLQQAIPEYEFQLMISRGGWHRMGGVVDRDGSRIADHLEEWVVKEADGSVQNFLDNYLESDYYITRFQGETHYLVASTGPRACDFLQLEVEAVQEMVERRLISDDELPDSLEDIIDPMEYAFAETKEIAGPRYIFRRITSVAEFITNLAAIHEGKSNIERFLQSWDNSSASEHALFCHHWVLGMREFTDAYGEPGVSVKPITTCVNNPPELNQLPLPRGSKLAILIHDFDRQVGYPMAWFFFMLTHMSVSYHVAESIHQDLMGAYAYLPQRDLRILIDWYDNPYSL